LKNRDFWHNIQDRGYLKNRNLVQVQGNVGKITAPPSGGIFARLLLNISRIIFFEADDEIGRYNIFEMASNKPQTTKRR